MAGRQLEMSAFQAAAIEQTQHEQEELRVMQREPRQRQTPHHRSVEIVVQNGLMKTTHVLPAVRSVASAASLTTFPSFAHPQNLMLKFRDGTDALLKTFTPVEHLPDKTTGESSSSEESSYCYTVTPRIRRTLLST